MSLKLKQFQEEFLNYVHPHRKEAQKDMIHFPIIGAGNLTSKQAYQVYTSDYVLRMTEVLGEQFSGCWKVLGDEDFLASCESYILDHPSQVKSLSLYGEEFPRFLRSLHGSEFEFIEELANFEWFYQKLFHSHPDIEALKQEEIIERTLIRKEDVYVIKSSVDLIRICQLSNSDEDLTWDEIDRGGIFILSKDGYKVNFSYLENEFEQILNDLDDGFCLSEKFNDYQNDPYFLNLTQEQWANFFSIIMKIYKLK